MTLRFLAALLAATLLAACGFDATPQSSGSTATEKTDSTATEKTDSTATEKPAEGEKKAD